MFHAPVRRSGDEFEVTIPESEVLRLGLWPGQFVAIEIRPSNPHHVISPEVRRIIEETSERSAELVRYLKDK